VASQFKNRLVGVTILVASVVIFLPTIIDGKKTSYEDEFIATPIQPEIKKHSLPDIETQIAKTEENSAAISDQVTKDPIAAPNKIQETPPAKNADWEIEDVAESVTVAKEPPKSVEAKQLPKSVDVKQLPKSVDVKQLPKSVEKKQLTESAWTIQLGAFRNAENINNLLDRLRKAGFKAYTVPRNVTDGVLTRVFVGPDVSQKRLQEQLPRLKKSTQLEGKILPFKATNP